MKTTLLAAFAALAVALATPAFAATHHTAGNSPAYVTTPSRTVGTSYRLAATDGETNGGSNPYATQSTGRHTHDRSSTHPVT